MEPVVYHQSPLADYLKDEDDGYQESWAEADNQSERPMSTRSDSSNSTSPSRFAPSGRPLVKQRFRRKAPASLQSFDGKLRPLRLLRRNCSAAVSASMDRGDKEKFLEQFRYIIIASQLLSGHTVAQRHTGPQVPTTVAKGEKSLLSRGEIVVSVLSALAIAVILGWILGTREKNKLVTKERLLFLAVLAAAFGLLARTCIRRHGLRSRREQSLSELSSFVINSHDLDGAVEATLALIQEVELVSRGYRISPLSPASRVEDRWHGRKCLRLRKALKTRLAQALEQYNKLAVLVQDFSDQMELEKYYDMYDISDFDIQDARQGFDENEFDDLESLRVLKVLAARFYTARKMFLCAMLALDTSGESNDLLRWTAAVETLQQLNMVTTVASKNIQDILSEEESFPMPSPPRIPLTPGRERWRAQLRKIGSLSTGIRGLQAKLHLLREESDRVLDDSSDMSDIVPNLVAQYDSIGYDLKALMAAWEEGKHALAVGIDRNEKRLSSMSTLLTPRSSMSGLTVADGETAEDAFKALTGESPTRSDMEVPTVDAEVFEAVAIPRPRSMLTREERLVKMKEDRDQKAEARQIIDATRGMLRELESVIKLRPKNRHSTPVETGSNRELST